jgi:DNA-binding transcriptional regulator YhcF (GntR family)
LSVLFREVAERKKSEIARMLGEELDQSSERPLSHQIADRVWTGVIDGSLETGGRLPTVRQLAIDLGVHPRVVERAYDELQRRGVVSVRPGGIFLILTDADPADRMRAASLEEACRAVVGRAEELGFTIDDVVETLTDLRVDRASRGRT